MTKLNPPNERIKRDYARYQREARGKSEATVDAILKALARFEDYTGHRDFAPLHREQAIGFKPRLASTEAIHTGEPLSIATQVATLTAVREFFTWLAWRPGFRSKIHIPDTDYFRPTLRDGTRAKAKKLRDFPSLEQIRAVIAAMPTGTTVERRNRALIAFTTLTGIRDDALASLSLRHIDLAHTPPLVRQEPDRVRTKFGKAINTYFFPLDGGWTQIVREWVAELQGQQLFAPTDPLFPRTRVGLDANRSFHATGIERRHWSNASAIRRIFREAFEANGLPYFPPHSFRHTLGHLMQTACRTPEQIKAWSQNLGHENVGTTLTSYGRIDPHHQGEIIGSISLTRDASGEDILARIKALVS
jgi:integrase